MSWEILPNIRYHTGVVRLGVERSQTDVLPVPSLPKPLALVVEYCQDRKCSEPVVGELVQWHWLLHWICGAADDLRTELLVQELDEIFRDGLRSTRDGVEGNWGRGLREGCLPGQHSWRCDTVRFWWGDPG